MVDDASTTATVPLYEECFRCTSIVHGSVRLSAVRRADPPARGSTGASAAYEPQLPRRSVRRRSAPYIALGFSWTLDCEKVLAGGVSR